eukprot:139068_1
MRLMRTRLMRRTTVVPIAAEPSTITELQRKQSQEKLNNKFMAEYKGTLQALINDSNNLYFEHIEQLLNTGQSQELLSHAKAMQTIIRNTFSKHGGMPVKLKQTPKVLTMDERITNANSNNKKKLKRSTKKSQTHIDKRVQANIACNKKKN